MRYGVKGLPVEIPVTFEFQKRLHKGFLCASHPNMWFLLVRMQYWGTLILTDEGWSFKGDDDLAKLTDYFSDVVIAWYQ